MMTEAFEPPANAFTHRFMVADSEIDELGHAGNVSWVRWVNDAATAHSAAVGLDLSAYRARGLLWVVRRHEIEYLAPAFAGETIEARTWIAQVRGATSIRKTSFRRVADDARLAHAATTWVLLSMPSGRPTRVPPDLGPLYGFDGG